MACGLPPGTANAAPGPRRRGTHLDNATWADSNPRNGLALRETDRTSVSTCAMRRRFSSASKSCRTPAALFTLPRSARDYFAPFAFAHFDESDRWDWPRAAFRKGSDNEWPLGGQPVENPLTQCFQRSS